MGFRDIFTFYSVQYIAIAERNGNTSQDLRERTDWPTYLTLSHELLRNSVVAVLHWTLPPVPHTFLLILKGYSYHDPKSKIS